MRLIDADELMKSICANHYILKTRHNTIDYGMFTIGIQQAVDEQPTIDPVKQGWWELGGKNNKDMLWRSTMPRKNKATPLKVCSDCTHYSACAAWNVGSIASMDGTNCANYERYDVNGVKRGRWVMDTDPDDGDCRCSNCRLCIDALHKRNHNTLKLLGFELHTFYKFCPNCGCLMTGSEE